MGEPGAGQGGTCQVGTGQFGTGQFGTGQVCTSRFRTIQVRIGQVNTSQAGQVSTGQNGFTWDSSVALLSPTCYYLISGIIMLTALIPGYKYQYWYGIIMRFGIGMGLDGFFCDDNSRRCKLT